MSGDYSINTGERRTFSTLDYVWFALSLALSSGIGLYHAIRYRKSESPSEFLIGGRRMNPFPVALSLIVTFLSPITLLGVPGEVYTHDTMFWWLGVAILGAVGAASHIFHVFFYRMKITSVFEYIFRRFGRVVRFICSLIWFLNSMMYQAFVLCGPGMAINAVTGLDLWISILSVGVVVTFYTTLGGMKTVIWTDSLQAVIIMVGLLAMLIQGSILTGGLGTAWAIAANHSRIKFDDFSPDPTVRHSFWSVFVGAGFVWFNAYSVNQAEVQRALSCSNQTSARLAMWMTGVCMLVIISLCCLIGIVMFAFYSQCDPLKFNNLISNSDQLLPLFVLDILHGTYGLPGIVLSAICAGTLSTMSSILNGMSAVALEDYVKPICGKDISNNKATFISKATVVVCGALAIGLAFLTSKAGSQMQISYSICNLLSGPIFGCFLAGMFIPRVKQVDMVISYVLTFCLMLWLRVANWYYGSSTPGKETSVQSCNWNVTMDSTTTTTAATTMTTTLLYRDMNNETFTSYTTDTDSESPGWAVYNVSYLYYSMLSTFLIVILSTISSFITGIWMTSEVDPDLIHPIVNKISRIFCKSERHYSLTGRDEKKEPEEKSNGEVTLLPMEKDV